MMNDLNIANKISALTKSNCISCVKDGVLLAIGMGMTSRIDAMKFALDKAVAKKIDTKGSSISSEAFFPFKDSVELANRYNISAIIEPGGSIRDDEVIQCANENDIALYFSGKRHFLH
jgi:phosphoribosylaminoimidazolecarboxamide formyltransferase/IMP cyclohydrolase